MKKQYNAPKVEKVEFNYEQNVVASGNCMWQGNQACGHWEGNLECLNRCVNPCKWVASKKR